MYCHHHLSSENNYNKIINRSLKAAQAKLKNQQTVNAQLEEQRKQAEVSELKIPFFYQTN